MNAPQDSMADRDTLRQILENYLAGSYTQAELDELLRYAAQPGGEQLIGELIDRHLADNGGGEGAVTHRRISELLDKTDRTIYRAVPLPEEVPGRIAEVTEPQRRRLNPWTYLPVAAALLAALATGFYFWRNSHPPTPDQTQSASHFGEDLTPAANKAVIILDNGEEIPLLESTEGIRSDTDGIAYLNGERISGMKETKQVTVRTPNAAHYKLVLPDQSVVWLNAASSISYPTAFNGKSREISIEGEAYLQVQKDPESPFVVHTDRQLIEVVGTSFNVSAYHDEPTSATTLIEGKVTVRDIAGGRAHSLKPGQQAVAGSAGMQVGEVDVAKATAWKDGYFIFEGMALSGVMRQLSRWYDVEVDYENIPDRTLNARIKRDKNISAVLNAISRTTGLDFYINERRMMVKR